MLTAPSADPSGRRRVQMLPDAAPMGLKRIFIRPSFPWLARHGLHYTATPWLAGWRRPQPWEVCDPEDLVSSTPRIRFTRRIDAFPLATQNNKLSNAVIFSPSRESLGG